MDYFKLPEPPEWQCRLDGWATYYPPKGKEPNAFHRFMQRLAFGFKWERITNQETGR